MANPPYSGFVVIVNENPDGGNVRAYVFSDVADGTPIPKGVIGLENSMFSAMNMSKNPPDQFYNKNFASKATLKTLLSALVDLAIPDSA